jgi:hypothetical protein
MTEQERKQPTPAGEENQEPTSIFGRVATQFGLLSREQINVCLRIQQEAYAKGDRRPLGQIAAEQGYLTGDQAHRIAIVQAFLEGRAEDKRFGEIALCNAFINREQLDDALMTQRKGVKAGKEAKRIGQVLMDLRYITSQQRDAILRAQRRLSEGD